MDIKPIRGHTFKMTSALRGLGQNVSIALIGCVNGTVTRGGVQKSKKIVDII